MRSLCRCTFLVLAFSVFCFTAVSAQDPHERGASKAEPRQTDVRRSTTKLNGLHSNPPRRVAIVGATVHRSPDVEPAVETILIDGTKIVAIGVDLKLPPGTKSIDGTGKHCYAGFIDAYVGVDLELSSDKGTTYWNAKVSPQLSVASELKPDDVKMADLRSAGFTSALIAPTQGVIKGQSSFLLLSNYETEHLLLKTEVAQHIQLTVSRGRGQGYPNSPMGAVALARQAMYDAQWYQKAWQVENSLTELPETNDSLEALQNVITGEQMLMAETSNELFVGRADRFAREFGLKLAIVGSGNEYRRIDEIASLNRTIVLPVNFPKAPDVSSAEKAADATLEDMMHWDHAPGNPALLAEKGIPFVLTTKGLKKKSDFLSHLRNAVKRGLKKEKALAAMTIDTARFYGVDDQIGTLEKNKLANITITDSDVFNDKAKVVETWVDGVRFESKVAPLRKAAGKWELAGEGLTGKLLVINDRGGSLSASIKDDLKDEPENTKAESKDKKDDAKDDAKDTKKTGIDVKPISLAGTRLTGAFRSDDLGHKGMSLVSMVVSNDGTASGKITLPDGSTSAVTATLRKEEPKKPVDEWSDLAKVDKGSHPGGRHGGSDPSKTPNTSLPASYPINFPLGAFGVSEAPSQPKSVLIKNVTVWSLDDRGKIENAAVLFGGGKIKQVFDADAELPEADVVIDGSGGHVTPGIIDCHSHMASDSGINESGQAITAEVRIGDMIDPDDINIYRQLAGGVTAANVLHGSANPIGGQNQVIKLRWGAGEQEMKFKHAPQGIKFALGENVKQSNWSSPTDRYPQTRMGVEQIIDDAFRAAIDYSESWEQWNQNGKGLPPRRDLELDALAEIVKGDRWVHCHSYRQDEILALIRTLDRHGITIGSFQHILEGYKVADNMAKHGAMASAFADWWAYKYEVKDAIPYAGALMHRAGVVVSFNSDDDELGRHLNQEAVKAVKYGGVSDVEAMKFVTLNPALQLRISDRVGSIEPGKDADIVLWSGNPLSNLSTVKQTWVDGRKYFDREEDSEKQAEMKKMRTSLVQKILLSGDPMEQKKKSNTDPAKLWPRHDEFCHGHGHDH